MRKALVAGAVLALAFAAGYVVAQPVTYDQVTGNECWSAGQGPGGPARFLCLNLARGGTSVAVLSSVAGSFTIGTGTTAGQADGGNVIITAQPSAATITMPANPVADGSDVGICNGT